MCAKHCSLLGYAYACMRSMGLLVLGLLPPLSMPHGFRV